MEFSAGSRGRRVNYAGLALIEIWCVEPPSKAAGLGRVEFKFLLRLFFRLFK
jgi:hypothetical protein